MGKVKKSIEKKPTVSKLARKIEKLAIVRNRIRKGKEWLRLTLTDDGEIIMSTKSLQHNHQILSCVLEEYGLALQDVDSLKAQAADQS